MNGLKRRIDQLERAARGNRERPIKLIFQEAGESKKQAMKRAGISELDEGDLNIFIMKWASGVGDLPYHSKAPTEPEPNIPEAIEAEIQKLTAELLAEGFSQAEINKMVEEVSHEPKNL